MMLRARVHMFVAALPLAGLSAAWAQPLAATIRNTASFGVSATDQFGQAFTVTGVSGITYIGPDGPSHRYRAVMDNSNRVIDLSVTLAADGSIAGAAIVGGLRIADTRDFEGIAYTTTARNSVFLSEETTPQVREYSLVDGSLLQALALPAVYSSRVSNRGLEALARRSDGSELWTANEEALTVDGPLATPSAGTVVRILRYSMAGDAAAAQQQFAYLVQSMHGANTSSGRSGLVELVALPSGRMLALERSLAAPIIIPTFQSRLYEVTFAGATDVSSMPGLIGQTYTPAAKASLWTGSVTNLEGLCLGPQLPGGDWSLLGIVDDGDPISVNTLVAFVISGPVGEPCAADFDGSGPPPNIADIFAMLAAWFAGDERADWDENGTFGVADVFAFLATWFGGC